MWKCGGSHDEDLPNQEEDLLPFFLSNPELVLYYNNLPIEGTRGIMVKEYLESLQYVDKHGHYKNASDEKKFCDHNMYEYEEDTWSRRLYMAIKQ